MTLTAITVEGGLFAPELIEDLAVRPEQVEGQRAQDFGLAAGTRLSDVLQTAYSLAQGLWTKFETRRVAAADASTSATRSAWALPFLQTVLDFPDLAYQRAAQTVGGQSFAISHLAGDGPGAVPVHVVAFGRDLDERGAERWAPHTLVQEYLNRTDALWGLVTNGRSLRLLRDTTRVTRPTYLEVDLEGIVGGGLYAEFALLWRLLHRSRFPADTGDAHTCLLERWYQQGIEAGGRVRERLRDGVEQALERLGQGFIAHPANDGLRETLGANRLTEAGFYRQLLRLIYRLLFLMVAEERRLVQLAGDEHAQRQQLYAAWYGIGRLRDRAERRRGEDRHGDLWRGLVATFALFREDRKAAALGLGVLDGELFGLDACPDLERAELRNDVLLSAIFELSTFEEQSRTRRRLGRRRVAYAALDVEELGSVYEGLLELHPKADVTTRTFGFVKGSERKSTGSYYTPKELVAELIKSALEPVLAERLAAASTPEAKERAILAIRVCDPAAGSGHFLLAAARRLGRELAALRSGGAEPAPEAYRRAVRDVVRHCLYAVDKNPLAVDLCKVALWLESQAPGVPLSFLDHRVRCGDALVGVFDLGALKGGVPDAAFKALTGDDKKTAKALARRNKAERKDALLSFRAAEDLQGFAAALAALDAIDEPDPAAVAVKARRFQELRRDPAWERWKTACDLWCAAFHAPKTPAWAKRVPTTREVWQALADPARLHPELRAHAVSLAEDRAVFHWPLEFPEILAKGGFDVLLGNPPWERIKLQEQEFFEARDPEIAQAPNQAARRAMIAALAEASEGSPQRTLHEAFARAKRFAEGDSLFVRESGRFPLTAVGDVNTYALFAEDFLKLTGPIGRSGMIVPTGIATDNTTKAFFEALVSGRKLEGLIAFENEEFIFRAVHHAFRFALLTLHGSASDRPASFMFFGRKVEHVNDPRRRFTLSVDDIALLNPNTRTCPVLRTTQDAELAKKIYRRVPVLVDEAKGRAGNPWGIRFMAMFHMANNSGLFRTHTQLAEIGGQLDGNVFLMPEGERWLPLYEAKMVHHFDHRWFSYPVGSAAGGDDAPEVSTNPRDPDTLALPRYWVEEAEVAFRSSRVPDLLKEAVKRNLDKLTAEALGLWIAGYNLRRGSEELGVSFLVKRHSSLFGSAAGDASRAWMEGRDAIKLDKEYPLSDADRHWIATYDGPPVELARSLIIRRMPLWFMGWRDICRSTDERTVIASVIPRVGVGHTLPLFFTNRSADVHAAFLANWTSLVLDYLARQKVGGTHLTYGYLNQLPFLPPGEYRDADLAFIVPHILQLTYTADDLTPWARDLGHDGPPFAWDPERRASLRGELDAYYAYLYGLTRDELRYVLDPKDVMGPDFPSETFRVLKENETRRFGEYRTRRLVLAAWDRFVADGTFDPSRESGLSEHERTKARLARAEQELVRAKALLTAALAKRRPVLFLEGASDVPILRAAWEAFHPGEPLPVEIVAAGGTLEMRSLAGKGGALRRFIGDNLVLALADNDGAGRQLVEHKQVRAGGVFVAQENGIHWAMLPPSAEFRTQMERFRIPPDRWPCTVEQMFTAALRREAAAMGRYAVGPKLCSDLLTNISDRITDPLWSLGPEDDAYWYVRAPQADCKEAFAAWIAAPERRTPETFAAFKPIVEGIEALVAGHDRPAEAG